MAVELEKIANLLEEASQKISDLEAKNEGLGEKVENLESELSLAKEAEDHSVNWDEGHEFGSVSSETPYENDNAESKLDNFLSD